MNTFRISSGSVECFGVFAVHSTYPNEIFIAGYFNRAKSRVKSVACTFGTGLITLMWNKKFYTNGMNYSTLYKPIKSGRDRFTYAITTNKDIGTKYVLSTNKWLYEDVFQLMMNKFKMPLLKEWVPYILEQAMYDRSVQERTLCTYRAYDGVTVKLHEEDVSVDDLLLFDFSLLTEETLQNIVSEGLKLGKIKITEKEQNPLQFENFDDYIRTYGSSIVENLEKDMEPLSPLKGKVDAAAFYHKRMYPQQGACVNGIMALVKNKAKYAFVAEGMGCGKTLQGAAVCDTYFNEKWLQQHPGKTLADLYNENDVNYRSILMAPSHLVEKWKSELEEEIPGVKATIIRDFSQLVEIRNKGIARNGREWYLISKDFCKLGSQYSPIPTTVGEKYPTLRYCKDCFTEHDPSDWRSGDGLKPMSLKKGKWTCPDCGGHNSLLKGQTYYGKFKGMLCPECGELLIKPSTHWYDGKLENPKEFVLTPKDFAGRNTSNSTCACCGSILWGTDVRPVDYTGQNFTNVPYRVKPKWRKVSHYKNVAKKSNSTAFVLRGHEGDYKASTYCEGWREMDREYGPRKHAPALFIKKYLKGYFDFCVLDECHKYENGGTAQTTAAQALVKASSFTLALTGTLTNGKADSLFYLLYLLDPEKMQRAGYQYTDVMAFCQKYGSVETVYEADSCTDRNGYNKTSRGRQIQSPRIKPGISPLLVTDFLLERSVFLDLSDLSKYLPKLKEEVVLVKAPEDVKREYSSVIYTLKDKSRGGEGFGLMGKMLIFGLSYLDKPFGRGPILSTTTIDPATGKAEILCNVQNFDEYTDKLLPKEEKLVELINSEIAEDRNCFVYASFTGEAEQNVTGRLKNVIEKNCNLEGRVYILEAKSPKAEEREAFIKKKATEGYRVIICNPKCVETGLDFCFWQDGKWYNYPTLIFYQISYELSVIWQASRRAYRLIQTEECRNYYLGYEDTLQAAALEVMAEKQVAASAIQGKFSAEGLSALAKGVDPRLKLAQMLSDGDMSDRKSLENMFDALNQTYEVDDSAYGEYEKPQTFYELMGLDEKSAIDLFADDDTEFEVVAPTKTSTSQVVKETTKSEESIFFGGSFFELIGDVSETFVFNEDLVVETSIKSKRKERKVEGQCSLFDLLAC